MTLPLGSTSLNLTGPPLVSFPHLRFCPIFLVGSGFICVCGLRHRRPLALHLWRDLSGCLTKRVASGTKIEAVSISSMYFDRTSCGLLCNSHRKNFGFGKLVPRITFLMKLQWGAAWMTARSCAVRLLRCPPDLTSNQPQTTEGTITWQLQFHSVQVADLNHVPLTLGNFYDG